MQSSDAYLGRVIAEFLEKSFRPVKISAPASAWRSIRSGEAALAAASGEVLRNLRLFAVQLHSPSHYCSDDQDFSLEVTFPLVGEAFLHPATFLASCLGVVRKDSVYLPLPGLAEAADGDMVTVSSEGKVPGHWMCLIADFVLTPESGAVVEELPAVSHDWRRLVSGVPSHVLRSLVDACGRINHSNKCVVGQVTVEQAPLYTEEQAKLLVFGRHEVDEQAMEQLQKRSWFTMGSFSVPTQIFSERCKRFSSLRCTLTRSEYNPSPAPYDTVGACEGGMVNVADFTKLWRDFALAAFQPMDCRCDVRGECSYVFPNRKLVSFDEMQVFCLALAAEGATFTCTPWR